MKRIISSILITILILTLSVTGVFAQGWKMPPGLAKKGGLPPGIAKKIFSDIDAYEWAKKAIEKMQLKGLVKGYGDGIYAPSRSVSQLESVIMALRVMGWEEEAKDLCQLPNEYRGDNVGDWAKGYINVAYEKGILDDVDMMYFRPNSAAKRHEVAKYVIRALGYEEEAKDYMDKDLDFVDEAALPKGSIGYVYLVNDMGLMKGDDQNRFNPMGSLTRAEMAVLFERLDNKVDSDIDEDEYVGNIYRLYDEEIKIEIDDSIEEFDLDDDVRVYDGRDRIEYSDLKQGHRVLIQIEDEKVVYIEIVDEGDYDKIISRYTGKVIDIDEDEEISISIDRMTITFEIIDDVEVIFTDDEGELEDIQEGDEITVVVDNKNRARKIYVKRELKSSYKEELEGVLVEIDKDEETITIADDVYSDELEEFDLDNTVKVYIEGEISDIDELEEGMEIELRIEDDLVYRIYAENNEFEVEGEIYSITIISSGTKIALEVDDEVFSYAVSEEVEIEIDDDEAGFSDLETGLEGEFSIENNTIVEISID